MRIVKIHTIKIIYFVLFLLLGNLAIAQETNVSKIGLAAQNSADSITLRWLVDSYELFKEGINMGYTIKRAEEIKTNKYSKYEAVATIKPWTKADWKARLNMLKDTASKEYKNFSAGYELVIDYAKNLPKDVSGFEAITMAKAQNDMSFLFLTIASCSDVQTANAMGLRWVDKNVVAGKKYKYTIDLASNQNRFKIEVKEAEAQAILSNNAPIVSIAKAENETSIGFKWMLGEQPILGYSLERSENNGQTFNRLNKQIILIDNEEDANGKSIGSLSDTSVVMYVPYVYRIIGHSIFADEVIIGTISAMARDRTPVTCIFVPNPEPTDIQYATLKWELTCKPTDLKGFNIRRDNKKDGKFLTTLNKNLLSPNVIEYNDNDFDTTINNFYLIETIDTAGNVFRSNAVSLIFIDVIPPSVPLWANSSVDSNGIVKIKLKLNKEKDFMGYRIFKANQLDHEFSVIKESFTKNDTIFITGKDSIFTDTISLNSLTPNVYYKATALDFHFNESTFSLPLKIVLPDTIKPVPPVPLKIDMTDSSLNIHFTPSSSADAVKTIILRRFKNDLYWDILDTIKTTQKMYLDTNLYSEIVYEYCLQAIDTNGLLSPLSFSIPGRVYPKSIAPAVTNLQGVYDPNIKKVLLTWNHEMAEKIPGIKLAFQVYKSASNESPSRITTIPFTANEFYYYDNEIKSNETIKYFVKVVLESGAESVLNNPAIVNIPSK